MAARSLYSSTLLFAHRVPVYPSLNPLEISLESAQVQQLNGTTVRRVSLPTIQPSLPLKDTLLKR